MAKRLIRSGLMVAMVSIGLGGCELIATVDRSLINADAGVTIDATPNDSADCVPVDDKNACTTDVCENGAPAHKPVAARTACTNDGGAAFCDGAGACVACLAATDCPGTDDACQTRACNAGVCGMDYKPKGTALPTQTAGDCKRDVCDGAGKSGPVSDDADLPVDNNDCTSDVCTEGVPSNPPKAVNTACGTGGALFCNASGVCAGCTAPSQCSGTDDECKTRTCSGSGMCGVSYTTVGTKVAAQTAHDCLSKQCNGSGVIVDVADNDPPVDDGNACTTETCNAGTPAHPAAGNGTTCNDGNGCTQTDTCQSGVCTGSNPVSCVALDQCHTAGTCDTSTGTCSNPAKGNGTTCNDGNGCTQTDTCQAGVCTGANPVTCTALDQCHTAGTCDTGTGTCSNPAKGNGTGCDDNNLCTTGDVCTGGTCGGTAKVCTASDQCHIAGTCDVGTGACSNPAKSDGSTCTDGNACTQTDTCQAGTCTPGTLKACAPTDDCHPGVCNTADATCSNPPGNEGGACTVAAVTGLCAAGICL